MGELITIEKSVGANGSNLFIDVGKIGAALVAVGLLKAVLKETSSKLCCKSTEELLKLWCTLRRGELPLVNG